MVWQDMLLLLSVLRMEFVLINLWRAVLVSVVLSFMLAVTLVEDVDLRYDS